ncbi:MAG: fluoride efflux transporter CrcB, partial [Candidatus Nanopelagicales bacterium]|nr:fluoride efflux transporter CrcB [Candidatus Nanopelagicales bacterium]
MRERVGDLYAVVAVGGACGAVARYGFEVLFPMPASGPAWPWGTFLVNVSGCLVLGIVLVLVKELWPDPTQGGTARLIRPLLVTGVLGGYTTFSTFAVETTALLQRGEVVLALAYAIGSVLSGVAAVALALAVSERMADSVRRRVEHPGLIAEVVEVEEAEETT